MNATDTQVKPLFVFPREVYESSKRRAQFALPPPPPRWLDTDDTFPKWLCQLSHLINSSADDCQFSLFTHSKYG